MLELWTIVFEAPVFFFDPLFFSFGECYISTYFNEKKSVKSLSLIDLWTLVAPLRLCFTLKPRLTFQVSRRKQHHRGGNENKNPRPFHPRAVSNVCVGLPARVRQ
jgi:hypothetical protein